MEDQGSSSVEGSLRKLATKKYCGIILFAGGGGGDGDALLLLQRDLDRRGQAGEQLPRTISPSNSISLCR